MIGTFLMQAWAGLPIALAVLITGVILLRGKSARLRGIRRFTGGIVVIAGSLLLLGATVSLWKSQHDSAAPGVLVDVGGHRVHVWCEGTTRSATVVWIPGGYGQGLWSYGNHADIRDSARSCIIDRRGVGWADAGPRELSPEAIAREVMDALAAAREAGPFLLAGHSFGGFYATNIAALYPQDIAGILLLDPTAPGWIDFFAYDQCGAGTPPPIYAFASLFGLTWVESLNPMLQSQELRLRLGEWWPAFIAQEMRPRTFWSQAKALSAPCRDLFSHVRWPDQLGAMPLVLITQSPEGKEEDAMRPESGFRLVNYRHFRENLDSSVLKLSSQSRHLYAPAGAGHDFPSTEPEFTQAQVLKFLDELAP